MCDTSGEYVCRRAHVSLEAGVCTSVLLWMPGNMHISPPWARFGVLYARFLTSEPSKISKLASSGIFVVKTFTKIITVGRAEGAAKFPVLAPLRCSTSRVCTAAALAPPLLRVCKYSPRHMRTLAIEYVSTGSVLTCALTSTEVSVGK